MFNIDKFEYFAPLSSPKGKHENLKNTLDILKIDGGKLGVVNFNNMIPVTSINYVEFDLNNKNSIKNELKRLNLISKQLRWLTTNKKEIYRKSKLLYNLYKNNKLKESVKDRCCNFLLLEIKCEKYNK